MVIKLSDASEICTHLKNNKACGSDNISYEHIKYGGKLLIKHLTALITVCRRRKDAPKMVIPYIADIIWIGKNTIPFL
jgi:hypothetical protein